MSADKNRDNAVVQERVDAYYAQQEECIATLYRFEGDPATVRRMINKMAEVHRMWADVVKLIESRMDDRGKTSSPLAVTTGAGWGGSE